MDTHQQNTTRRIQILALTSSSPMSLSSATNQQVTAILDEFMALPQLIFPLLLQNLTNHDILYKLIIV